MPPVMWFLAKNAWPSPAPTSEVEVAATLRALLRLRRVAVIASIIVGGGNGIVELLLQAALIGQQIAQRQLHLAGASALGLVAVDAALVQLILVSQILQRFS